MWGRRIREGMGAGEGLQGEKGRSRQEGGGETLVVMCLESRMGWAPPPG